MRIVAGQAIANGGRVNASFNLRGIFVAMASEAELVGSGGDQLDVSDIPVDPNLVATQATHRDCGMDRLAFGLILMASQTGCRIGFRIERYRMLRSRCAAH